MVRIALAQQAATQTLGVRARAVRPPPAAAGPKTVDVAGRMAVLAGHRVEKFGRTGPPGWTMGLVADQVAPFTSSAHAPEAYDTQTFDGVVTTRTNGDAGVIRYAGMGGEQARQLLGRLTPRQLSESQGAGPSLGSVLGAAARNPGKVEVIGYLVGPHRTDERLTATGVLIYDETLETEEQVLAAATQR